MAVSHSHNFYRYCKLSVWIKKVLELEGLRERKRKVKGKGKERERKRKRQGKERKTISIWG